MERPDDEQKRTTRDAAQRTKTERIERDRELDQELKDTFPASDPIPPKHVD